MLLYSNQCLFWPDLTPVVNTSTSPSLFALKHSPTPILLSYVFCAETIVSSFLFYVFCTETTVSIFLSYVFLSETINGHPHFQYSPNKTKTLFKTSNLCVSSRKHCRSPTLSMLSVQNTGSNQTFKLLYFCLKPSSEYHLTKIHKFRCSSVPMYSLQKPSRAVIFSSLCPVCFVQKTPMILPSPFVLCVLCREYR